MQLNENKKIVDISIIIPTMNRLSSLKRTIEYILKGNTFPLEIIIIDQSSDKKIIDELKLYTGHLPIKTIFIHLNAPSSTVARNIGFEHSNGNIVIFMDDDVDVREDTLKNIEIIFESPEIVMLAGLNEKDLENEKDSLWGYIFLKKSFRKRYKGYVTKSIYGRFPIKLKSDIVPTEWAMGFFSAYKREYIKKWELLWDEKLQYYAYAEDLDFSYSYYKFANKAKLKCIISRNVIVKHNVSMEYRLPSRKQTFMLILHREYLSYKHFPSVSSRIAVLWANIGEFFNRLKTKNIQTVRDLIDAEIFCYKHHKDIKKGNFHYEDFI